MWSLLPRNYQVLIVLGAGMIVAWAIGAVYALAFGEHLTALRMVSLTATIGTVVLVILAEWLWRGLWRRFPILQKKLFPDLNGTWQGKLISTWINPDTGQVVPPINATITVRQTLFSTSVSLQTGESESHSTRSFLERFPETNRFRVWYSYNNEPRAKVQDRSSPD